MQNRNDDDDDPLIESLLDAAMAGYEHVLPPPELDAIREALRDDLLFTPEGQRTIRRLRAEATQESGAVRKDGAPIAATPATKKTPA